MSPATPTLATASRAYRGYVLAALVLAYMLNVLDRVLISVLNEPIREAFGLSDLQMGLLGGPAFAILYTVLGLPIARLAERFDRRAIIGGCLIIWSAMTVLCGLAGRLPPALHAGVFLIFLAPLAVVFLRQRLLAGFLLVGGAVATSLLLLPLLASLEMLAFGLLLIARIGVGIGEAGLIPPGNSLIADYFPAERRATALSIFSLGAPLGGVAAALGGAWLAQAYDWRTAFLALGLPGVALGVVLLLTVREPLRDAAETPPPFGAVLRLLLRDPIFRHVAAGAAIASFVAYGMGQFTFAFFSRTHGLTAMQASLYFVVGAGLASAAGTFLGGFLSDRLASRTPRAPALLPGVALVVSAPLYVLALLAPHPVLLLAALTPAALLHYTYIGPTFALTQSLVQPRMRATAIAVLAFVIAMIGYGLGPPLVGWLSDALAAASYARETGGAFASVCAATTDASCAAARAEGLRTALVIAVLGYAWAGLHFLLASRHLRPR